jgi:hypothetical protein
MTSNPVRLALLVSLAIHVNCGSAPTSMDKPVPQTAPVADVQDTVSPTAPITMGQKPTPAPAPPTKTDHGFTFGNYEQTHVAFDECDMPDMCEVEVKDLLTIADAGDGAVDVKIEVNQDNGHSCSFVGILAQLGPAQWGWSDETQSCQIDLKLERGTLNLTSDGCRETYCGARAQLQGTFALSGLAL